jgi:CelD/BcsL family acetyltransferase involved in cellulose biosynthesis
MEIVVKRARDLDGSELASWSKLQRADAMFDSPFFRPEFVLAADAVRGNAEVALVIQDGELVGFFPFERDKRNIGRAVAWQLSDAHGLIVRKGVPWAPLDIVHATGLVAWKFDHLIASQEPFQPFHYWVDQSPYMDIADGFDVYRAERRRSGTALIRQAERKSRKLAREVGPIRFEYHTLDEEVFTALLSWKSTQLEHWRLPDIFRVDWVVELLGSIRHIKTPGFSGIMSALYAGDTLTAVHLGLQSHNVLCSWIPTLNQEFKNYSPGVILHLELAKAAAEAGVKRIDLGRGNNPLKTSLGSGAITLAIGSVDRRPLVSATTAQCHRLWKAIPTSKLRSFPPAVAALRLARRLRNRLSDI